MKTFLICVLMLTLLVAAVVTRPSAVSFRDYLTNAPSRTRPSLALSRPDRPLSDSEADMYLNSCTVSDRVLWVSVRRDGKTIYTGVFAHWFPHAAASGRE